MRWIWIDRILEIDHTKRCVAIKNVTLAEDVLHDHFPPTADHPAMPVLPNPLIIEGMAQTAGLLVGHANAFREKVILAKIAKADFFAHAWPGFTLRYEATIDRIDAVGAATSGIVHRLAPGVDQPPVKLAEIELLFSHLDRSGNDLDFPQHNFVFTGLFADLFRQSGVPIPEEQ